MDIHCKADPFSSMHREYSEQVYAQQHAHVVFSIMDFQQYANC